MAFARTEVKELEPMVKAGKKKFVRYQEGAELYCIHLRNLLKKPVRFTKSGALSL